MVAFEGWKSNKVTIETRHIIYHRIKMTNPKKGIIEEDVVMRLKLRNEIARFI